MIIASARGTLQHLEPPLLPPAVEVGEPLSLLNSDNNNFRRLPVGVCVGDARTHYHRVNNNIVLCSPKNRPKEIKVLPIETVVWGVPGYPSTLGNTASARQIPTSASSPTASNPLSTLPIRTPASRPRMSTLAQALNTPTRAQPCVPSGLSTFSPSQPLPSPSMMSQPRASTSKATTSSQPSSSQARAGGSGSRAGVVSRTSSQASDSGNAEVSIS
ncbi:hypothetical protein FRC09_001285 [Ceratobasidium sp. 395]|nr:hypothetical protein FRC09_001285 [Ceratobasidium sp. 395]